jgi:hypothetical protein
MHKSIPFYVGLSRGKNIPNGMFYARGAQDSCTRAVHCASVRTGCVEPEPPTIA